MAAADSLNVTLVSLDPSILSCWEEKVKQGFDCSLTLKHSDGKVTTVLECSTLLVSPDTRKSIPQRAAPNPAEIGKKRKRKRKRKRRKKSKGGQKKLESLLAYQERLVKERGLPPSRLMLKQAAAAQPPEKEPVPQSTEVSETFKCDSCDSPPMSEYCLNMHILIYHEESTQARAMLKDPDYLKTIVVLLNNRMPP